MAIIFKELKLKDTFEIQLDPKGDERGYFVRTYDDKIFREHGIHRDWVQENESFSVKQGTVRGLHFQYPPDSEGKLIRVVSGGAFIVWADIRKNSPTYGEWDAIEVSALKKNAVFIPRGFANGLCALTPHCALLYKMDNYYKPESQATISWNDPDININWPVAEPTVISERDLKGISFKDFDRTNGGLVIN